MALLVFLALCIFHVVVFTHAKFPDSPESRAWVRRLTPQELLPRFALSVAEGTNVENNPLFIDVSLNQPPSFVSIFPFFLLFFFFVDV
jgi:hypothetical protein